MSKKLLLADDSITIQKVIQITFAHEDYELTITDNGDAALAKAAEIKPDLIMADVYMPGKNGYELAAAIKQDPALQHVPVLLLAGSFEPFDEDKARSCKAEAWIEKPFESQSLIDRVAELLSAAQAAQPVAAPVVAPAEDAAPAPVEDFAFDETTPDSFAEPSVAEPAMAAAMEDPFGDISFEDEVPAAEAAPVAAMEDPFGDISFEDEVPVSVPEPEPDAAMTEDWGEVALETTPQPLGDDVFAPLEEPAAGADDDFGFTEEPALEVAGDYDFAAEEPPSAEVFAPLDEVPGAEAGFDSFDMGEEEILPLGDDDILGAEDLEPVMEEQTLAAWSRTDTDEEDAFARALAEEPAFEEETFAEPAETPYAEELPATVLAEAEPELQPFAEPAAPAEEPVMEPAAEPAAAEVAAPPAAVAVAAAASAEAVEAKVSTLSEAEVEQLIEKVVTQVVEKLAGAILEKVAWEVVPDLAENLIREEIRKIKSAAA